MRTLCEIVGFLVLTILLGFMLGTLWMEILVRL